MDRQASSSSGLPIPPLCGTDISLPSVDSNFESVSASSLEPSPLSSEDSHRGGARTPPIAQLDAVHQPPLDEIECYDTATHCYLIGTDCDHASYYVLSFPKKAPVVSASSTSTSKPFVSGSDSTIDGSRGVGDHTAESTKPQGSANMCKNVMELEMNSSTLTHSEMLSLVDTLRRMPNVWHVKVRVLLGAIYLTKGYYLVVAHNRQLVARIGPHRIFKAENIALLSLMVDPNRLKVSEKSQQQQMKPADVVMNPSSSVPKGNDGDNSDGSSYAKPQKQSFWHMTNISSAVTSLVSSVAPSLFGGHRDPEEHYRQQLISLFTEHKNNSSFYYSHTYDLTNTLQTNMTVPAAERMYRMKYVWNEFLLEPFDSLHAKNADGHKGFPPAWFSKVFSDPSFSDPVSSQPAFLNSFAFPLFREVVGERRWRVFAIRGVIIQQILRTVPDALPFSITLITRVSKEFAGARYLRRGISREGHAANHVEVEQILCDESSLDAHYLCGSYSSYVQVRGSVPLRWFHPLPMPTVLKPPISLANSDGLYTESCRHFQHLLADYGAPIVVMDYLKQMGKQERELKLGKAYRVAMQVLGASIDRAKKSLADPFAQTSEISMNSLLGLRRPSSDANVQMLHLNSEDVLRYKAIDLRRVADRAWNVVTAAAEEDEDDIGLFVCRVNGEIRQQQQGVVRSNCIDCVDRTNIGQLIFSLHALGRQLEALGLLHTAADLVLSPDVQEALVSMYLFLGDAIATQYGGSPQVSAGVLHRGMGWDQFMGIKRLYNNMMSDEYKQGALNLFLGSFRPYSHPENKDVNAPPTSPSLQEDIIRRKNSPLSFNPRSSFVASAGFDAVPASEEASKNPTTSPPRPVSEQLDRNSEDSTVSLGNSNPMTTLLLLSTSANTDHEAPTRSQTIQQLHAQTPCGWVGGKAEPAYCLQSISTFHTPGPALLRNWWIEPLVWWQHTCARRLTKEDGKQKISIVNTTQAGREDNLPEPLPASSTFHGTNLSSVAPHTEARRQWELCIQELCVGSPLEGSMNPHNNTNTGNNNSKCSKDSIATTLKSANFLEEKDISENKPCLSNESSASQAPGARMTPSSFSKMVANNISSVLQSQQQPILLHRSARCARKISTLHLFHNEKAVLKVLGIGTFQAPFFRIPFWNMSQRYKVGELTNLNINELDNVQSGGADCTGVFAPPKTPTALWHMKEYIHDHPLFPRQVHTSVYEVQQKKLEEDICLIDVDNTIENELDEGVSGTNPDVPIYFAFQAYALFCLFGTPVKWTNDDVEAALRYCATTPLPSSTYSIRNLACDGYSLIYKPDHSFSQLHLTAEQRSLFKKLQKMAQYFHNKTNASLSADPSSSLVEKETPNVHRPSVVPGGSATSPKQTALFPEHDDSMGSPMHESNPPLFIPTPLEATCAYLQPFFCDVLTLQTLHAVLTRWMEQLRSGVPQRDYIRYTTQYRRTSVNISNRLTMPVVVHNAFSLRRLHRWLIENCKACRLKFHVTNGDDIRAAAFDAWRLLWWAACNSFILPIAIDNGSSFATSLSSSSQLGKSRDYFLNIFFDPTTLFRFPGIVDTVKLNCFSTEEGSLQWVRPLDQGMPRNISDRVPPTVLIEKLSSLALNAVSEFQREIVTGSLSLADSVKIAKVLLESVEVGTRALRHVDLRSIPSAERLCFFVNLYNTLYAHAWMSISARGYSVGPVLVPLNSRTTMALPTNLIEDFYRTHGYVIGIHWVSCYTIKYAILTGGAPPQLATPEGLHGNSLSDELSAESYMLNCESGANMDYAAGQIETCQVDVDLDGFSRMLIDTGLRCSTCIVEPLHGIGDVRTAIEAASLIHDSWEHIRHDVKFYVPRRIILALLDTYLPPPSLVPDGTPTWAVGPRCPFECGLKTSCDIVACTEADRHSEPRRLLELKLMSSFSSDLYSNHSDISNGGSATQNAWTMLGNATMQVIAMVGATNDPYWGLSLFQRCTQPSVTSNFLSKCPMEGGAPPLVSPRAPSTRLLTHLCVPLVASAATTYGYDELICIEKDFIYSAQKISKMKSATLNVMLAPILIQYPDIFGQTSDAVLHYLQQSQQSAARAVKCQQTCLQRLTEM